MSVVSKQLKSVNFSPNEALAYGDLNDMQKAATQRAWECPEFSNVLSVQRFVDGYPSWGGSFESTAGQNKLVFTKGNGLQLLASGFVVSIFPGFLGIFSGTTGFAEFGLSSPTPLMRWAAVVLNSGVPSTLPAVATPAAGNEIYSLIEAVISDAATDVQTRHFKSAASGAKSTASTAKRRGLSLTLYINDGAMAALNTAVLPTLTAGRALVGYTRQTNAGIQEIYDCTVPFGPMRERVFFPTDGYHDLSTLNNQDRTLNFTAINGLAEYRVSQDPRERILGLGVTHSFVAGTVVKFQLAEKGSLSSTDIISLTGGTHFPADGTPRDLLINNLGKPIGAGGDVISHPIWGGGRTFKHDGTFFGYQSEGLLIRIISGGACSLYGVRVYSALA